MQQKCRTPCKMGQSQQTWKTALDVFEEESCNCKGIQTFCQSLDKLLRGGIRPGIITEVVGLPGVGKTTFCLQLCLNVQIPKDLHGYESEAIYIATDHSFSTTRLSEIAGEFVLHCNKVRRTKSDQSQTRMLRVEDVLSKTHIAKCCDADELAKMILSVGDFIEENGNIKILVIDSIAFPFYGEKEDFANRVKVLYGLGQMLFELSDRFKIAIVLTNNLTTRFGDGETTDYLVPFLGDAWNYVPNERLVFTCHPDPAIKIRNAELLKSSTKPLGSAKYRILSQGFRD